MTLREVESGSPQSGNKSLVAGMHLVSMKEGVSEARQLDGMSLPEVEALLAAWSCANTEHGTGTKKPVPNADGWSINWKERDVNGRPKVVLGREAGHAHRRARRQRQAGGGVGLELDAHVDVGGGGGRA